MGLIGDLFRCEGYEMMGEDGFVAEVCVDAGHRILGAHFPGHPILPGACLFQMTVDVVGEYVNGSGRMKEVKSIKFQNRIEPVEGEEEIWLRVSGDAKREEAGKEIVVSVAWRGVGDEKVYAKMQLVFEGVNI